MSVNKVTVFGAGTMGHGIAQCAAMNGFETTLADVELSMLERGRGMMAASLDLMVSTGRVAKEKAEAALSNLTLSTDAEAAAKKADVIFEAVFENLELKRGRFKSLGEWTGPEVVLASNTSSFDISLLSEVTRHPERVIGAHWFHPPQITPAVEIIPTAKTSDTALAAIMSSSRTWASFRPAAQTPRALWPTASSSPCWPRS